MGAEKVTTNIQHSEFALKLRKYRIEHNLSYSDLGKKVKVSTLRIGLFELDKATPTWREMRRIKKLLAK